MTVSETDLSLLSSTYDNFVTFNSDHISVQANSLTLDKNTFSSIEDGDQNKFV